MNPVRTHFHAIATSTRYRNLSTATFRLRSEPHCGPFCAPLPPRAGAALRAFLCQFPASILGRIAASNLVRILDLNI